ncbi:L-2-hydroxyglutarate oxidase [Catalinimonas alkaloidigena]|uniref:L-2-hydroxyglutarate oxidase n=1 Tax=Catalinimonas alkaloidigena TaxID=1075417 RepID=A0A1G9SLI3_9BACT|nr:L-2-hydroxyglutarate oxidase [Catalinimonas alkaloidigena]SDM36279.1 L-2-hydroxyglutarate oxidase [Catalinimonas alkaloidigena]
MQYDIIIIGGGIVGMATALKIKQARPELKLAVLEKEMRIAAHQTGNNSGVIHSGIYYKPGSLKAKNCISGYKQLLAFCDAEAIPYEICGKIIVATHPYELPALNTILERGHANGLEGLKKLSRGEITEYEPHVSGIEAIWVPQTGIVDYKQVTERYAQKMMELGGELKLGEKVLNLIDGNGICTVITSKANYGAKLVINCAGLYSDKIALMTRPDLHVRILPFRGEYYELHKDKEYLVKNLIYPVPDPNFPFLGVHFTRMVGGGIEAGPNAVMAFKREGYKNTMFDFDELLETVTWPGFRKVAAKYWETGIGEYYRSFSKKAFTQALQRLIPEVQEADLHQGGAGVRAQACDRDGNLLDDFSIVEDERYVHVLNAPSPAATSSLSIGDTISELALKRF